MHSRSYAPWLAIALTFATGCPCPTPSCPQPKPCKECKEVEPPPDPQIPIDLKSVAWVELLTLDSKVLAYVLIGGRDVGAQVLETAKGKLDVPRGGESWFSPSVASATADLASVDSFTWKITVKAQDDSAELVEVIDQAAGLSDAAGFIAPDVIGPSGPVLWTRNPGAFPTGVKTFGWQHTSGFFWHLSLRQVSGRLTGVFFSTNNGELSYDQQPGALPSEFAAALPTPIQLSTGTLGAGAVAFRFDQYYYEFTP
jgi:hypothetical protein